MTRVRGAESEAAERLARTLYAGAPARVRLQQRYRPFICAFDPLLAEIRETGGRLLDFGCGAGLLTFHCAARGFVSAAVGVDVNEAVVAVAAAAAEAHPQPVPVEFRAGVIPAGTFDAITMIDVMHHIAPAQQRETFDTVAGRLAPGGVLVYKDIGEKPRWRAAANLLHDLVLNRQVARYVPMPAVIAWAEQEHGLRLVRRMDFTQLVYGHELAVFRRPATPLTPPPA